MKQGHYAEHWLDAERRPAGGVSTGKGFTIAWQNGPLGALGTPERREPNGAFVEDVIQAVIERLEFYQQTRFASTDNRDALAHLYHAAEALDRRTRERVARNVEGTHTV